MFWLLSTNTGKVQIVPRLSGLFEPPISADAPLRQGIDQDGLTQLRAPLVIGGPWFRSVI
jgi:hypothetical protein